MPRPKPPVQTERIITPLAPSLVRLIDDFRFARRLPSRSEAIRRLVLAGLEAENETPEGPSPRNRPKVERRRIES